MHLILNPAAAGGRLGRDWPALKERLLGLGFDVPVSVTRAPGHATDLAGELLADREQVIVAAGGDGTICEIVEGIHRAGRGVLGILPLGTGNDICRTLGVPLRLEAAVRALLDGARRRVDLMRVADRVVLNAIGVGLLGDINLRSTRIKKVRGIAAYLAAALGSLFGYGAPDITIEADTFSYRGSMLILAVHSGPTTGGGFRLTPGAVPDDGVLDAILVENLGVPKRLHRLVAALRGTLHTQKGSHPFRFTRFELRSDRVLPAHLDGNPWQVDPPGATFEVLPGALEVVAPAIG